ncbi:MAG: leucine-rich repeat domain-containing protein, partial [Cyanobacteria bacterium J06659_2]
MPPLNLKFESLTRVSLLTVLTAGITSCTFAQADDAKTFEHFADWCENQESLTPEAHHTVDVLLTAAET